MSDIKFACPQCQQHIQCETGYGGMEIACPSCNTRMIVPAQDPPPGAPQAPAPAPAPGAAGGCPSCGAALARGAVLCTSCGYNLVTKQKLSPQAAAARRGVGSSIPAGEEKWYKTPYPYFGAVAGLFAILYAMAMMSSNPLMKLPLVGAFLLYVVGMYIAVAFFAFKESVGYGIMALLPCGILQLYLVYKVLENRWLQGFMAIEVLVGLAINYTLK